MLQLGDLTFLENTRILITGGTGSLGRKLAHLITTLVPSTTVLIYSRDEFKQYEMEQEFTPAARKQLRFFLGDVRDRDRLTRAMTRVEYVIHAAALKQVPAAEYNPFEFVKTNIVGAENVISAAIDTGVKHTVALSTDKAVNPVNLYGATKLCSDKMFVSANSYSGPQPTRFSVVRYGNVVGSRGSVIPFFLKQRHTGVLPITHPDMTRFWITLEQGASLVLNALREMKGGEVWVPRIPSMRLTDLADLIGPACQKPIIGIRPGEKMHEVMIPVDDARLTQAFATHYIITPAMPFWQTNWHAEKGGQPCSDRFYFGSDNNPDWISGDRLASMIASLDLPEAQAWAKEHGIAAAPAGH